MRLCRFDGFGGRRPSQSIRRPDRGAPDVRLRANRKQGRQTTRPFHPEAPAHTAVAPNPNPNRPASKCSATTRGRCRTVSRRDDTACSGRRTVRVPRVRTSVRRGPEGWRNPALPTSAADPPKPRTRLTLKETVSSEPTPLNLDRNPGKPRSQSSDLFRARL